MDSNRAWLHRETFSDGTIDPRLLALHPREEETPNDIDPSGFYSFHSPGKIPQTFSSESDWRHEPADGVLRSPCATVSQGSVLPFEAYGLRESADGVVISPCGTESSMTLCLPARQYVQPVHTPAADTDTPMTVEVTQEVRWSPLQSAYVCDLYDCGLSFRWPWEIRRHKRTPHAQGHFQANISGPPFECKCGDSFTKRTSLHRHILSLRDSGSNFECTEAGCTRYRKEKAFQRKDHLVQHLRTYHKWTPDQLAARFPSRPIRPSMLKVCHFSNCPCYRDDSFADLPIETRVLNSPFKTQSEYSKHMKDAHEWTPFSCDVPGCDKSGKKGYFSETALAKHRAAKHP